MKSSKSHRYIVNVLLKSVRVFRTKLLKTQVQVVVFFIQTVLLAVGRDQFLYQETEM